MRDDRNESTGTGDRRPAPIRTRDQRDPEPERLTNPQEDAAQQTGQSPKPSQAEGEREETP